MKRWCEFYFWAEFKELLVDEVFSDAVHVVLEEDGHYDFTVEVTTGEDDDTEITQYTSKEIVSKMASDFNKPYEDSHVDHNGVWLVFTEGYAGGN